MLGILSAADGCRAEASPVRWVATLEVSQRRRREWATQAIRVHAFGGPEALLLEDVPEPSPGAGQALVRLDAAGVNFVDIYQRTGLYPLPLPFVVGSEGAGIVQDIGPGVDLVRPGDRVAFASVQGSYAEAIVVSADRLVRLPDAVSTGSGAAILLQGMTAHFLLHSIHTFRAGDRVLIQACAGGTGLLLTQMAKHLGLYVIGTTSTDEKAERASVAGADRVVLYTHEDVAEAVRNITGGEGVQVVFDSVGQSTFDGSLRCLAPRGTLILFGQSSGPVGPVDPARLQQGGSLMLTRPRLTDFIAAPEELAWRSSEVLDLVANGTLDVRIHARYSLNEASDAHRALESRRTSGKLLLQIGTGAEA